MMRHLLQHPFRFDITGAGPRGRWTALVLFSLCLWAALSWTGLTAAPLLAAMAAALILAALGAETAIPKSLMIVAQGIVGVMIAKGVPPATLGEMIVDWPVLLVGSVSVIVAGCALGLALARTRILPGSVALWGSFPGGATVMVLMAGENGADARLVAFMQYSRLIVVSATASLVAWVLVPGARGVAVPSASLFPPIAPATLLPTVALCLGGSILGQASRIPAGAMLLPMLGAAILQGSGLLVVDEPPWMLLASFAVIGWSIGGRFTRPILGHAARAAPRVLASVAALIAICAGFGALLSAWGGVDPLTAYLATSPGGVDSVAIIANGAKVDLPFVMALQTSRFVLILMFGPLVARALARLAERLRAHTTFHT